MTERRARIPTTSQILKAERERAAGEYEFARDIVQPVVSFPLGTYARLKRPQQQRHLMAARIAASSEISLAREQLAAPRVAEHLSAARQVITTIYENPSVQHAAQEIHEDVKGAPYEFATEMARDIVSYMLTYAALTGNTAVVTQAIERMDAIMRQAKEPTIKTLTAFEKQRILHKQESTDESFSRLTRTFEEATAASLAAQNGERAATIAARYIIDAEQRGDEETVRRGTTVYETTTSNNGALRDILQREREEERTARHRERLWRITTPDPEAYAYLALPLSASQNA